MCLRWTKQVWFKSALNFEKRNDEARQEVSKEMPTPTSGAFVPVKTEGLRSQQFINDKKKRDSLFPRF